MSMIIKFDEQAQIDSVQGALALRPQIEEIVNKICAEGYKNICWLGIGGTWASCLQAEVHMKEMSSLNFFVENNGLYTRITEEHSQRFYSIDELRDMLSGAGFEIENDYLTQE